MVSHDGPHPDLGGYVLEALEPEEAAAFAIHLEDCEACRREVAELSGLRELLGQVTAPVEVPPQLRQRTLAAIEHAAEDGWEAEPQRGSDRRRHRREATGLRKLLAVAAAAVVAGTAVAVIRDATRPEIAAAEVVELQAPPGRSGRAVAKLRPTATGGVIEMRVEGLPEPPDGFFYECWLVSGQGDSQERPNRVSVGTFTVDGQGRAEVRWDFTADTRRFPRMGVTLEPDDGNPVHTTDRVLGATRPLAR